MLGLLLGLLDMELPFPGNFEEEDLLLLLLEDFASGFLAGAALMKIEMRSNRRGVRDDCDWTRVNQNISIRVNGASDSRIQRVLI